MKKSEGKPGTLIMAATHIGCLDDVPKRALEALATANLLIFEEDKPARQLLKRAGLTRPYLLHNEHGDKTGAGKLALEELRAELSRGGMVLYASDQGSPGVADPGRQLVEIALEIGARVRVIPGPSSITAAIAACPFDCRAFHYAGFLPRESDARRKAWEALSRLQSAVVLMDTPYRLTAVLEDGHAVLGDGRRAFLALDITGPDEDYWVGALGDLATRARALPEKRNFVLVLEPKKTEGQRPARFKSARN